MPAAPTSSSPPSAATSCSPAPISRPTEAHDLDRCLANIVAGFDADPRRCSRQRPSPSASPSPARPTIPAASSTNDEQPAGLSAAAWPSGPMLEDRFGIPVFINNDGDLFVYGEAIAGFLPYVNDLLEKAGSPKRYQNLFGVTLGTGFGGGIVRDGELLHRRQLGRGRGLAAAQQARSADERRGGRLHPRRPPRLCAQSPAFAVEAGAGAQDDLRHRHRRGAGPSRRPRARPSAAWAKWPATPSPRP